MPNWIKARLELPSTSLPLNFSSAPVEATSVWFTDPFGRNGRPEAFPGSIRQVIARMSNDLGELNPNGPGIGRDRPYGSSGVHAPN